MLMFVKNMAGKCFATVLPVILKIKEHADKVMFKLSLKIIKKFDHFFEKCNQINIIQSSMWMYMLVRVRWTDLRFFVESPIH